MMRHLGDITKLDGAAIEPVWCVTGGSPCQDLSIAGKRAGLAGARSGLFMEQIRVIKEMREHDKQLGWAGELIRPRYMVWENVPGALSSNKGRDFAAVLEETIRIVEPEAPSVEVPEKGWPTWGGYRDVDGRWSVAWRVHDAQYWGVPQRRRRIALVADFGGDTAHEILFERTGVSGDIAESGAAGEGLAETAEGSFDPAVGDCMTAWDCQSKRIFDTNGKSPTLQGGVGGGVNNPAIFTAIPINDKATRWQGGRERRNHDGSGNGLGIGKEGDPSPTLTSGDRHGVMAVALDMTHAGDVIRECGETVPSLQARMGTGGNQAPLTYQMQDFGDYRRADVASACKQRDYKDSTDLVIGIDGECNAYIEQYGTLRAHASCGAEETLMHRMVVRRLTPLECERLQGFPDGWTDIGDYTDSTGKKRKTSDSARYKALGNSIALPFWRWMFGRMAAYLPEGATLGSLFDGIGGFPLCWEDVHGAGTAVWASEIEEFPIAVTKKRFGSGNMIRYTLNIEPPVEPPAYTCPICPVCGEEADTLYKDRQGNVIGCTACITEVDAWTL